MSEPNDENAEDLIGECSACGDTMLTAYLEDGICYQCRTTDAD